MAWRVLQNGAMLEVVNGLRGDTEITATQIYHQGAVIEKDLSKTLVDRYDAGDEFVCSIVERVRRITDGEGNQIIVSDVTGTEDDPAGDAIRALQRRIDELEAEAANADNEKGEGEGLGEDPESPEDTSRVQELEAEVSSLKERNEALEGSSNKVAADKDTLNARVTELEGERDEAISRISGAEERIESLVEQLEEAQEAASAPQSIPYARLSKDALEAEAGARKDLVVTGTGADGNVLKDDLVKALTEDDARS